MQNDTPLPAPIGSQRGGANQCKPEEGNVNLQPADWIQIIVFTAFGLAVASQCGVFRRKSIRSSRGVLTDRRSSIELLIPAFAGFCASIFAPAVYYRVVVGAGHHAANSHQTVCMFAISAGAGLLLIQWMDISQKINLLRLRLLSKGLFLGILGALATIPLVLAATVIVQDLMNRAGAAAPEEHQLLVVFQQPSMIDRLLVILSAVILAPLFEELTFRGHLQSAIRKATGNPWFAVAAASALFALVHGILWMMPPLFILAIGLGYVYERTRNIWANILIHALFNALSLTVEYLSMKHR